MRYFTIEQRETLERQLRSRATELRREIDAALEHAECEDADHLAKRFKEIDDEALANLEEGIELASLLRDVQELRAVKEAIQRIHSPDFGVCADCEGEIPYARLKAQPMATRCRACEALSERASAQPVHAAL